MRQLILTLNNTMEDEQDHIVGTLEITNTEDHLRDPEYGNYRAIFSHDDKKPIKVRIMDWDQNRDPWELVEETLRTIREAKERKSYKEKGPPPPLGDFPEVFKEIFGI